MEDNFFKAKFCERCGAPLTNGRIMSMYNTQVICMECKEAETHMDDYVKAHEEEMKAVRNGNLNFEGIGYEKISSEGI